MKTNLKPYNSSLYTPSRKPLSVNDLVITLDPPRGYVAIVVSVEGVFVTVRFLDTDTRDTKKYLKTSLIQTGKTPEDLIRQYEPTPISLDQALDKERSFIDFSKIKKKPKKGGAKKPKELNEGQKKQLALLILQRLKEFKEKGV